MGAVSNLKPRETLEEFLDFLWGTETGFAYVPYKTLNLNNKSDKTGKWNTHYFRWPQQKAEILKHIEDHRKGYDVYIAPALFATQPDKPEAQHVKGSYTLWVDFDGHVPSTEDLNALDLPMPSWRNCSSKPGHEHWFWRMPNFMDDKETLQRLNKALTYALSGDLGGHSPAKVLRPVSGLNHKRDHEEVTVINKTGLTHAPRLFEGLRIPEDKFTESDFNFNLVPPVLEVLAKHKFTDLEIIDLLQKVTPTFRRSDALARLAHSCAEMGMTNHEIYSLIAWKDKSWKKFSERENKEKYYIDLVNYVLNKHSTSVAQIESNELEILGYMDHIAQIERVDYLIEGFLTRTGQFVIGGKSGTGKTSITLDFCRELAVGRGRFGWNSVNGEPLRILFLSLEMPGYEINEFLIPPTEEYSADELKLINQNLKIYSKTDPIKFYDIEKPANAAQLIKLKNTIMKFKPHIMVVDSASVGLGDTLTNMEQVNQSMRFLYRARNELNFALWLISHTRKDPPKSGGNNMHRLDKDDIFGAQSVVQQSTSILGVQEEYDEEGEVTGNVLMTALKMRFSPASAKQLIRRKPNGIYYRPVMGELPTAPVATKEEDDDDGFISV